MTSGSGIELGQFLRLELELWQAAHLLRLEGPCATIDARACAVLAPVLRELVHGIGNSGVRADERRQLAISWRGDDQGRCVIDWSINRNATNGSSTPTPTPSNSDASIPLELMVDGMIRFELSETGARLIVPQQYVRFAPSPPTGSQAALVSPDPIRGRAFLVVEDQLIIALDLEMLLREEGATEVHVFGTVPEALALLAVSRPDAAVLDVNLGSTTSFPVAEELARLSVPFIFATGYGKEVEFPQPFRSIPLVGKPYCGTSIREALAASCFAHS